jgi:hypothetical protein
MTKPGAGPKPVLPECEADAPTQPQTTNALAVYFQPFVADKT